ncbi:MAG: gamma carbonic anhydrase family protein [Flavobacteriales bacterium]|jgi:carbonic anhydrase/acetyltransferase-like protein (isoleucine patch superfamily)|nr:gamma carbonic anhydrase family protein [Flavobacteriales bacterium]
MALIKKLNGINPKFGNDCYFSENATIIGDVTCGDNCSFWFNSVVRGDVHSIKIGNGTNIQDGAVIHCTYKKNPTEIGNHVTIGHNAIVHGCTIKDNVLVGMGAVILDRCIVESNSIIAAGAVLTMGTQVKSGEIYAGTPAKKIKSIAPNTDLKALANQYIKYTDWYK